MKYILLVLLFLLFPFSIAAKSISFTTNKTSLKGDDEMTVTASASGFATEESIYIKGAFYKEVSSNPRYFGYTKNDSSWIKNTSSNTSQRKVTIGQWDGTLIVKGDYEPEAFKDYGNGEYQFKIRFYTIKNNGDDDEAFWSTNSEKISLEAPPPTNTPTQTPTKTPTPQKTPTPSPTAGATVKPTVIPTKKTTTPTPTLESEPTGIEQVLGEETTVAPTMTPIPTEAPVASASGKPKNMIIALGFVGAGLGVLSLVTLVPAIRERTRKDYVVKE